MADYSQDKFREAGRLFEESRETFYDGHEKGMRGLSDATGRERAERLAAAVG